MAKPRKLLRVVPARLKEQRKRKELTQNKFAEKLIEMTDQGCSTSLIMAWESGRRTVSDKYMDSICEILDVSKAYLYGLLDDPKKDMSEQNMKKAALNNWNKKDTDKKNDIGAIIELKDLFKYDHRPVYVEFEDLSKQSDWGIYNHDKRTIVMADTIFELSQKTQDIKPDFTIYQYDPHDLPNTSAIDIKAYQLTLRSSKKYKRVFIRLKSATRDMRQKYNGWYHHADGEDAFIGATGLLLPYDGFGITYNVYSPDAPTGIYI